MHNGHIKKFFIPQDQDLVYYSPNVNMHCIVGYQPNKSTNQIVGNFLLYTEI